MRFSFQSAPLFQLASRPNKDQRHHIESGIQDKIESNAWSDEWNRKSASSADFNIKHCDYHSPYCYSSWVKVPVFYHIHMYTFKQKQGPRQ